MKMIYSVIIIVALLVLCSECDNLAVYIISKLVAAVVIYVAAKLLEGTMTDEELNEEV